MEIKKSKELHDYEIKLFIKNGKVKIESVNAQLLIDQAGKMVGIKGVLRDITERKETEMKMMKQMRKLELLNKHMIGREKKMIELKKEINDLLH